MKFIYLIQGDLSHPEYDIPEGCDCLYLQWKDNFVPRPNHFHHPNSSWAEGRNELYRRAKEMGHYDYYVFLDDDLRFGGMNFFRRYAVVCRALMRRYLRTPFQVSWMSLFFSSARSLLKHSGKSWLLVDFEIMVELSHPKCALPNYTLSHEGYQNVSGSEIDSVTYGDQCLVAVHHSIVDRLLPYNTSADASNWWWSGEDFFRRATALCPGHIHRYNWIYALNRSHRLYPRPQESYVLPKNKVVTT